MLMLFRGFLLGPYLGVSRALTHLLPDPPLIANLSQVPALCLQSPTPPPPPPSKVPWTEPPGDNKDVPTFWRLSDPKHEALKPRP